MPGAADTIIALLLGVIASAGSGLAARRLAAWLDPDDHGVVGASRAVTSPGR